MSDGTQAVELLPCPFCGGMAIAMDYDTEFDTWSVKCNSDDPDCLVAMHSYNSQDKAIAAWNRRATPSPVGTSVPSEVVEVLKLVYRKHHMGDPSIGWDELSDAVLNSLSNAMGVEELVKWQEAREDASNG